MQCSAKKKHLLNTVLRNTWLTRSKLWLHCTGLHGVQGRFAGQAGIQNNSLCTSLFIILCTMLCTLVCTVTVTVTGQALC